MLRILLIIISFFINSIANACTAIAASGNDVVGGGTLIAKNRDAPPTGFESVKVVKPKNAYSYIELVYGNSPTHQPYISSGVNQYGLAVTVNDEDSQSIKGQDLNKNETEMVKNLLSHYKSIDQIENDANSLFTNNKLAIYTISDFNEVASFQVGQNHKYAEKITKNGYVWNTNYYNLTSLKKQNSNIPITTKNRNQSMMHWLNNNKGPYQVGDFYQLMASHYHDYLSSISRAYTVAKFIVVDRDKKSNVYINFTIPTQKYQAYRFTLEPDFFSTQSTGLLSDKFSVFSELKNTSKDS